MAETNNKIPIVIQDGTLIGVFTTLKIASDFAHAKNDVRHSYEDKYHVYEYEIHSTFSIEPKWFVRISPKGDITEINEEGIVGIEKINDDLKIDVKGNYFGYCAAKSNEQAIQIIKTRLNVLKLTEEIQEE